LARNSDRPLTGLLHVSVGRGFWNTLSCIIGSVIVVILVFEASLEGEVEERHDEKGCLACGCIVLEYPMKEKDIA
jgi:hypothetical protein